jgi:glutamate dehydrogenase
MLTMPYNNRYNVMLAACPPTLLRQLGLRTILARVPDAYTKAIFCAFLASQFIYRYGLSPPDFAFFEFVQEYLTAVPPEALEPKK